MASNVTVTILDTTTNPISVKVGAEVKYSKDGGSTFTTAVLTDAKGIATNTLNLGTGQYDLYVDSVLNTSYADLTLIDLNGNKIKGSDIDLTTSDGNFGNIALDSGGYITGTPSVSNNGQDIDSSGLRSSFKAGTASIAHNIFSNDNGAVGFITTSGVATNFITSSDPRNKSKFKKPTRTKTWERIDGINDAMGIFQFLSEPATDVWGFDAHKLLDNIGAGGVEGIGSREKEIGSILTDAERDKDGNIIKKAVYVTGAGVDLSKLVPYLLAGLVDLQARILKLEGK